MSMCGIFSERWRCDASAPHLPKIKPDPAPFERKRYLLIRSIKHFDVPPFTVKPVNFGHPIIRVDDDIIHHPFLFVEFKFEAGVPGGGRGGEDFKYQCGSFGDVGRVIGSIADDEIVRLIAMQFDWRGTKSKPMCSCFIGTSPEFEIAAYTICLLLDRDGRTDCKIGEYEVELTVHSFGRQRKLGSAYISASRLS